MLSSFGIRAYRNLHRKFFLRGLSITQSSSFNTGLGQRHSLAGFGSGRDVRPDNVCWCCAGKSNRDRNEKPEVCGRSEAVLVVNSPGRRHCLVNLPSCFTACAISLSPVKSFIALIKGAMHFSLCFKKYNFFSLKLLKVYLFAIHQIYLWNKPTARLQGYVLLAFERKYPLTVTSHICIKYFLWSPSKVNSSLQELSRHNTLLV